VFLADLRSPVPNYQASLFKQYISQTLTLSLTLSLTLTLTLSLTLTLTLEKTSLIIWDRTSEDCRVFCSCDFDLDPMTLTYEFDLGISKMYLRTKNEVSS